MILPKEPFCRSREWVCSPRSGKETSYKNILYLHFRIYLKSSSNFCTPLCSSTFFSFQIKLMLHKDLSKYPCLKSMKINGIPFPQGVLMRNASLWENFDFCSLGSIQASLKVSRVPLSHPLCRQWSPSIFVPTALWSFVYHFLCSASGGTPLLWSLFYLGFCTLFLFRALGPLLPCLLCCSSLPRIVPLFPVKFRFFLARYHLSQLFQFCPLTCNLQVSFRESN